MKKRFAPYLLICLVAALCLMAACGSENAPQNTTMQDIQTTDPSGSDDAVLPQESCPDEETMPHAPAVTEPSEPEEKPTQPVENTACKSHTYGQWKVVRAATCTASGLQTKSCKNCGDEVEQILPAAGHTVKDVPAKKATCTQTGLTAGQVCAVCRLVLTEQQTVPALEHSFTQWEVTIAPGCASEGCKERKCSVCTHLETLSVPATGVHDYSDAGICSCGAASTGSDFLTYQLSADGTYYICTGTNTLVPKSEIVIPSFYNGKPVKEVGTGNCTFCITEKIVIMEGVEKINDYAFYVTDALKEVYLPASLNYIGQSVFGFCDQLEAVYVDSTGWKMYSYSGLYEKDVSFSAPDEAARYLREQYHKSYRR